METRSFGWWPGWSATLRPEPRALLWLTGALALRLAREGLVLRALAGPGLLTAGSLVGAAALVGWSAQTPTIAVTRGADTAVEARLRSEGFAVVEVEDAASAVAAGAAPRGFGLDGGERVLWSAMEDPATLRAEAAIRAAIGAPWTLATPPPAARPVDGDRASGWLLGLLSALYALYGVVLGAGTLARDRDDGALEAELALPLPFWVHGAARLLAGAGVLAVGLGCTLLLLHGLLGVPQVGAWAGLGAAAGGGGVALGLGAMSGDARGFSGALSRALSLTLGLTGLGWFFPAVGAWLPIASTAAMAHGAPPSGLGVALCTWVLFAWAIRRFARGEAR